MKDQAVEKSEIKDRKYNAVTAYDCKCGVISFELYDDALYM